MCSLNTSLEEEVNQVEVTSSMIVPVIPVFNMKGNSSRRWIGMGVLMGGVPGSVIGSQGLVSEDTMLESVMKFDFLDSFLVFIILSFLSGPITLTSFLRTTFLILICLLTSHQKKGIRNNQAWDYSRSANLNKSTVQSTSTKDPESLGSYQVGLAANHLMASHSASSTLKIWT